MISNSNNSNNSNTNNARKKFIEIKLERVDEDEDEMVF